MIQRRPSFGGYDGGRRPLGGYRLGPGMTIPPVVKTLLLANVGLYLLGLLAGWDLDAVHRTFGFVPQDFLAQFRLWQLFTYMFLHAGFLHVGLNMFLLWMFGSSVEQAWGSRDFLIYYLVCGIGGGLTFWVTSIGSPAYMIGASGAVYGVMLAYGLIYPERTILLYFVIPIKMKYLVWIMIGGALLLGLFETGGNIAHFAHLGGMLFGWLYLKQDWRLAAFGRKARGWKARRQMARNAHRQEQRREEMKSVDEILDKISTQGIDSLTDQERRILRDASRR